MFFVEPTLELKLNTKFFHKFFRVNWVFLHPTANFKKVHFVQLCFQLRVYHIFEPFNWTQPDVDDESCKLETYHKNAEGHESP